ncbi:MAG: hypothetical protein ACYCO0_03705 [Candidatus Micrarchaeaceae archaeon]
MILNQKLTYPEAQKMAQDMDSRLPTLKEFIMALKEDPKLYERAKGREGMMYWLGDESGISISGFCRIDYENCTLVPVSEEAWKKLPDSERAFANEGSGHMVLYVFSGDGVGRLGVGTLNRADEDIAGVALVMPIKARSAAGSKKHPTTIRVGGELAYRLAELIQSVLRK